MIHQRIKDVYYGILYPTSRALMPLYRIHYKLFRKSTRKCHIGSGTNYLPGFINIDGNFQRKVNYILDIRAGLPFPDNSIDFLYSCHVLEHVHITEAICVLKECLRVLSPTGHARLTLPDFDYVFDILSNKATSSFPRKFKSKTGMAVNYLFCDGQHKYAFSRDVIEELASDVGFSRIESAQLNYDSNIPDLKEPPGSFSVRLFK